MTSKNLQNQNYKRINSALPVSRENNVLGNFNSESIVKCWELLCNQILRNYQSGKGTYIPKFGNFTFQSPQYSLEGTTNQVLRDKKTRNLVFIVSNDFVQSIRPGIISEKGSITHYEQRQNNGTNSVKINTSEIALSLNIGKAECSTILDNLIKFLGDKIRVGEFINKDLPGVGSLILRNKMLGVKFNQDLVEKVQNIPQKLMETKKHINLATTILDHDNSINPENKLSNLTSHSNNYQSFGGIRNLPNLSKSVASFRPQSALLTSLSNDGEKWLKNNLNIDCKKDLVEEVYPIVEIHNSENEENQQRSVQYFNDTGRNIKIQPKKLKDLNLTNSILENLVYQKNFIVSKMKSLDFQNRGQLTKEQMVQAFVSSRIEGLDSSIANAIVNLYMNSSNNNVKENFNNTKTSFSKSKVDFTDYTSLVLSLVKDIKEILVNKTSINKFNFTSRPSTSNDNNAFNKSNTLKSLKNNKEGFSLNSSMQAFKNNMFNNNKYSNNNLSTNVKVNLKSGDVENTSQKTVKLEDIKTEIITIKTVASNIRDKYSVRLNQVISSNEFCNILREFSIIYPLEKVNDILSFLELDSRFFTLVNFFKNIDNCKILVNETLTEDIVKAIKKIRDVCYSNGGKQFFFPNFPEKQVISKEDFLKKVRSQLKTFAEELCLGVFYYITKMDRDMTYKDYVNYFESNVSSVNENLILTPDNFLHNASETIINKMVKNHLKEEEYFERFLRFKNNRTENLLTRYDFHFGLQKEKFEFSAEERDVIFNAMDKKKDNVLDRDEFVSFLRVVHDPLFKLQDTIKKNNLEIEEILFRMNISPEKHEVLDFWTFKTRMKLLNSGFSHEFIFALFLKLKNADDRVDTRRIIQELNVFKKLNFRELNTESFKSNFLSYYKRYGNLKLMKDAFEKRDSNSSGLLDKVDFCNVVLKFNKQKEENYNNFVVTTKEEQNFEDLKHREEDYRIEDVMKICRICELYGKDNKVNYPKFLELVFYDKTNNNFNIICDALANSIKEISNYIQKTDKLAKVKTSNYSIYDPVLNELLKQLLSSLSNQGQSNSLSSVEKGISIADMQECLSKKFNITSKKSTVQLLDTDKDGYISQEDLKSVLGRYLKNHYFKYENIQEGLESRPNFYCEEVLSEEKFKLLVMDIKAAMKLKNLTDVGMFNKLDTNKDGFVSAPEFNENIDLVFPMASNIKDQFFAFLDVRKLGLVDLETFKKRFKEFSSVEVIIKNDWETEERIITEFNKYLKLNCLDKKLTIYEIFALLDANCDGKVDINDFKRFVLDKMLFSIYEINDFKIERVLQHVSRSKLSFFTIHDVKEYINDFVTNSNPLTKEYLNYTKEKFNVNPVLKGVDWLNSVFEKFGLYVTENFANFENFFEAVNKGNSNSEKIKLNDFISFISLHNLALKGFNLTQDELVAFFSAFDSHKKSFISLADVKNKLSDYDFYKRMKNSVKTFLKNNFKNGPEAFKFFIDDKNVREEKEIKSFLTKKEFFEGIKNIFPDTYSTENILTFIKKNFQQEDYLTFAEFNYVFFDEVAQDNVLSETKTFSRLADDLKNPNSKNSKLRASSAQIKYNPKNKLVTPYDEDALEKLRRLLKSSRFNYDSFFKMYDVLNNGFINQSEFRNMIKKLNIGLTGWEIDEIISKSGKNREGKIHMEEFYKFINYEDKNINQISNNVKSFITDLKQLVYKYYANPRLAFQFVSEIII